MTIKEIADTLPNGFHDAQLLSLSIDYAARKVTFSFSLWVGTMNHPAGPERERYALTTLLLENFQYCVIEPPVGSNVLDQHDQTSVDGVEFRASETELPKLDEGLFRYEFFGVNWNASIYVAARSAKLSFDSSGDEEYVRQLMAES